MKLFSYYQFMVCQQEGWISKKISALPATSLRKDSRRSSARRDSHLSSYDTTAVEGINVSGNGVRRRGMLLEYNFYILKYFEILIFDGHILYYHPLLHWCTLSIDNLLFCSSQLVFILNFNRCFALKFPFSICY